MHGALQRCASVVCFATSTMLDDARPKDVHLLCQSIHGALFLFLILKERTARPCEDEQHESERSGAVDHKFLEPFYTIVFIRNHPEADYSIC